MDEAKDTQPTLDAPTGQLGTSCQQAETIDVSEPCQNKDMPVVSSEYAGVLIHRIVPAVDGESDLVPGQYEGGLKVWECSVDLLDFFLRSPELHGLSNVLELGCGSGLPGIAALMKGSRPVVFTDFNMDVGF